MGSGGLLGASWTIPDTFWTILEISKILEKLLLRTYFEPLDRSRMILEKSENIGKPWKIAKLLQQIMIYHE